VTQEALTKHEAIIGSKRRYFMGSSQLLESSSHKLKFLHSRPHKKRVEVTLDTFESDLNLAAG
jgi:ornithine carbamoyltransferase